LTITDASDFVSDVTLEMGSDSNNTYTFSNPTASRDWCVIQENKLEKLEGPSDFTNIGSEPFTEFQISNEDPSLNKFKILTTFSNGIAHKSPIISVTVKCTTDECIELEKELSNNGEES
jgi:hypothetical protein